MGVKLPAADVALTVPLTCLRYPVHGRIGVWHTRNNLPISNRLLTGPRPVRGSVQASRPPLDRAGRSG